jgi:hypothetical protein
MQRHHSIGLEKEDVMSSVLTWIDTVLLLDNYSRKLRRAIRWRYVSYGQGYGRESNILY